MVLHKSCGSCDLISNNGGYIPGMLLLMVGSIPCVQNLVCFGIFRHDCQRPVLDSLFPVLGDFLLL